MMISHHQFLKKNMMAMMMRRRLKFPHTHKSLGFSQCVCLKCICMCMFYFKVSISSSSSSSSRHELLCPFCCLYTIFVIVILLAWPDDWLCWVLNYVISYFYLTQWVMFCVQDENVCVQDSFFYYICVVLPNVLKLCEYGGYMGPLAEQQLSTHPPINSSMTTTIFQVSSGTIWTITKAS